jgi:PAS domain S-box-containing protein
MILRDGSVIEVEANVKKISDTRLMAIVRDVTERNMAKAHLQRTYERLNYHLNNTPLAVIEEDKDFNITYWNRQAEEIFGWKADEVLGRRIVDFMVFEEDTADVCGLVENLGNGISHKQPNENRNYTKRGNVLHCEWYHSLLRDEQGRVETILSIVRDITDIRRKEEKLQKFLELLKELSFVTSHELRNEYAKVQSVLNYLESAQEEGRSLEEKDKDFLLIEATRSFYNINEVIGKLNAKISSGQGLIEE